MISSSKTKRESLLKPSQAPMTKTLKGSIIGAQISYRIKEKAVFSCSTVNLALVSSSWED